MKHCQRLAKCWLALLDQLRLGTKRDEIEPNLRSVTEGNYLTYYRILSDGIEVARVLHTAQDIKRAFFELAAIPDLINPVFGCHHLRLECRHILKVSAGNG